ncbi:preprotein translocase subunit SecG [Candidatus Finniella inopinata]|uniref:Protein-export membrane protein SecG n=1 Tax=Candidatus Finniella inopinata TaxID=1696036 RepID=A0A4Q7DJI1_9PROT|nr:preprotein translocase subunit SecG [Candidatus Finniella inopinata]RZI46902.1 preprotein translocase subunit SecG [Candidatus Finniella inopinata]
MNLLLTIHILITISLIGVILLQRSEGGGGLLGGSGSGAGNSMFTARGAANLLTRITAVLAVLFIGNCILMTIITSSQLRQASSLLDTKQSENPKT